MALHTRIKHIDNLTNGVLRFRRRFPKDVAEHLGQGFLQVHIRNREGLAFHREYQAIVAEFDRIVRQTRVRLEDEGRDSRTTQQKWHDALITATGLREGVRGLDPADPDTGRLIIETLKTKPDPLVTKALLNPAAPAPKPTLGDAFKLYRQDKQVDEGSKKGNDLNRIEGRLKSSIGDPDSLPLQEMTVDHRRRYFNYIISAKKADGSPLSLGSAKKETNILVAVVNHALKEMDILAKNQFAALPWPEEDTQAVERRLPLPDDLVVRVEDRLKRGKIHELVLIWQLLKGTGLRLNEAVGLTREDIILDAETPYLHVRHNSIRRIKTGSSVRTVPLTGDALIATQEALEGAPVGGPIFPRYGRPRGNDAASVMLMDAIKAETKHHPDSSRFATHGLRHRVSDMLREAGAPVEVRKGFLGHANQDISENTYGGRAARLREFHKWAVNADL